MQLDDTHLRMLAELRGDGRMSISALAERVGVSRANAYARLEAMQEAGVVRGFTVQVDPVAVGKLVSALVFVSLHQDRWADFRGSLSELPQLEYFAVTTGEHDGMLLVRAGGVAEIHQLVVGVIAHWPSIRSTETVFLMDEEHFPYALTTSSAPLAEESLGMTRFIQAPIDRRSS